MREYVNRLCVSDQMHIFFSNLYSALEYDLLYEWRKSFEIVLYTG